MSIREARLPADEPAILSFIDGLQDYEAAFEPDPWRCALRRQHRNTADCKSTILLRRTLSYPEFHRFEVECGKADNASTKRYIWSLARTFFEAPGPRYISDTKLCGWWGL